MVFSREKKSIFKKRKNDERDGTKLDTPPSAKDERKFSPKLSSKSFRKVARMVKLSGGVKKSQRKLDAMKEGEQEVDERDQGTETEETASSANSYANAGQQDPCDGPKRPTDISLRQMSTASTTEAVSTTSISTPSSVFTTNSDTVRHVHRSSSSSSDDFVHVSVPSQASDNLTHTRSKNPQAQMTPILPKLSEARESPTSPHLLICTSPQFTERDDFFCINEMHICICGQWLCVSNSGGVVMAFNFQLKNTGKKNAPKVRVIHTYVLLNFCTSLQSIMAYYRIRLSGAHRYYAHIRY